MARLAEIPATTTRQCLPALATRFLTTIIYLLGFQHWKGWEIGIAKARYCPDPDNYSDKERDGFDIGYKTETFNAKYYLVKDKDESHGRITSGIGNSNITLTKTDTQGTSIRRRFLSATTG